MITASKLVKAIRLSQTNMKKTKFSSEMGYELGYAFNTILAWEDGKNDMPMTGMIKLLDHFNLTHLTIDELENFCNAY